MPTRFTTRLLAGLTLTAGLVGSANALPPAPKAEELAGVMPRIAGVNVSTPAAADLARCRVEPVPGADGKPIGYALIDANGKMARRVIASDTPNYNIWCYYLDGVEVYRETDGNKNGKPDQFRWLGANGSKWGLDPQEAGRVTQWPLISAEEVSREVFDALVTKDAKRIEALLPTAEELAALGLPAGEVAKVQQRAAGAVAKLTATATTMNLTEKAKWVHVELGTPQTTPKDAFGGKYDVVRHRNAGVLVDKGDGKAFEFFQTGELVQVVTPAGFAWRLIDGPTAGNATPDGGTGTDAPVVPEAVRELVKQLADMNAKPPANPAEAVKFHVARAAILEKVVDKLQADPATQLVWLRQLIEAHSTAAELGDKPSADRLKAWKEAIDLKSPKSAEAAFIGYRVLTVENRAKIRAAGTNNKDVAAAQTAYKESLEAFVKDYPNVEETPEALYQLAMGSEYSGGRAGEASAREWYATLAKNFPQNQLAGLANGAVRRLDSEGQLFALTGPTLDGKNVNVADLTGKPTVVYYWASWWTDLKRDAEFLTELAKKSKGNLNIVTVCMDSTPQEATKTINAVQLPGTHLFQTGGGLATAYGVMGPHLFLIGKDGKVSNKNAQIPAVADEVEKMLK